jgi:16S rRNA (cytosine1402-N4)-methyltransferase
MDFSVTTFESAWTAGRRELTSPGSYHVPVLLEETVALVDPKPGRTIVDVTLGGGGHTRALLEAGADVIALDRDAEAIANAAALRSEFPGLRIVQANFANLERVLHEMGITRVDGIVADFGVSSRQIDAGERGFSFMKDGPLDMRMDTGSGISAADLVNTASAEDLSRIFFEFGEERQARRIARAIERAREKQPLRTTLDLASTVESVVPRFSGRHPATRVFQALRIAVNGELDALHSLLNCAPRLLSPGGRFAAITFHSLEDRAVKRSFRERSRQWIDRPEWPAPRPNPEWFYRLLTTKPVEPSDEEQSRNPRSRSARVRAVERLHNAS